MELEDLKKPFIELHKLFGEDYKNWTERVISVPMSRKKVIEISSLLYNQACKNDLLSQQEIDLSQLESFTEINIPFLGKLKLIIKD